MTKLETAVSAYRQLLDARVYNRSAKGTLSPQDYEHIKGLLAADELLIEADDENHEVEFDLPSGESDHFALRMEDMLENPKRQLRHPARFYLAESDYIFEGDAANAPAQVLSYISMASLADMLLRIADHSEIVGPRPKAVFLQGEKLTVELSYEVEDLIPLPILEDFQKDFITSDIHAPQKIAIIKSILFGMAKNNTIEQLTLPCIARRFTELSDKARANYDLYVSEFSFEKIKAQVEQEKYELTLKLNNALSEIQNQLLAIPIALVLVGGQMEQSDDFPVRNMAVWLGSIVFALFMSLLIRNQRNTLDAIRQEIDSQWASIRSEHLSVAKRLEPNYDSLRNRYWYHRIFLMIISTIVAGVVCGSTYLLWHYSPLWFDLESGFVGAKIGAMIYLAGCIIYQAALRHRRKNEPH